MSDRSAKIVGGIIGLSITAYFFVYAPMQRNFDQCGRITLCEQKP